MIDIDPGHLATIHEILEKHSPDLTVWAFGSRVKKTASRYSDLDIALIGNRKIDAGFLAELKEELSLSDLPFQIDLVDWNDINDNFRNIILQDYEVIQP